MSETNLAKIAITASSDNDLSGALDRVNRDFEGGRVTKTDMASWLILRAISTLDEAAIEEIRKAQLENKCEIHGFKCPDNVVREHNERLYLIAGNATYNLFYCPWCGADMNRKGRNMFLSELLKQGSQKEKMEIIKEAGIIDKEGNITNTYTDDSHLSVFCDEEEENAN